MSVTPKRRDGRESGAGLGSPSRTNPNQDAMGGQRILVAAWLSWLLAVASRALSSSRSQAHVSMSSVPHIYSATS